MTPQRWSQIKAVFHGAIERPAEARADWLRQECGGDDALRSEVERLLQSHDTVGAFLEKPAEVAPEDVVLAGAEDDGALWTAGARVGEFEIIRPIGRGGMGVVYLATDRRIPRQVALKALPVSLSGNPELRDRLRREALAASKIRDTAVATVYSFEEVDGHLLLVTEYLEGQPLRALIDDGPIDAAAARSIGLSVARGLRAAHDAGVIHRDLKPENIMVEPGGSAKIVDFGIARLESPNGTQHTKLTHLGAMIGTPAYMAPEQLVGGTPDARSDIYAFGVILTEMLTGRHPLTRGPHPSSDAALQRIADRARDVDRDQRFPNANELVLALEQLSAGLAPTDASAVARVRSARYWWDFHQGAAAVSYAVMLIPAWFARGQIGGVEGRSFFIATAVAALVASMLRLHLWFMSQQHASELAWARRRSAPWIRLADVMLVVSLVIGAGLVAAAQSSIDVVLLVLAVGVAIAFVFIEPSTARAAGLDQR